LEYRICLGGSVTKAGGRHAVGASNAEDLLKGEDLLTKYREKI
jgi:hypothetical protein